MAETSGGEYCFPCALIRTSPFGDASTAYDMRPASDTTSVCLRPMKRFTDPTVFVGLVTACRLATWPTRRVPFFANPTTDGVVRAPS